MQVRWILGIAALMLLNAVMASGEGALLEEKVLVDIETAEDVRQWDYWKCDPITVSSEKPLKGQASGKVVPGTYITLQTRSGVPGDWSGYEALRVDFNNTTGKSLRLSILVGDKAWLAKDGGTYWNRHNSGHIIPAGKSTFTLPIQGLYRGEAGSRFNDLKDPINPAEVARIDFGVGKKDQAALGPVYMDNIRLVRAKVPDFIKAYDLGPESQNQQLGFVPVTWNTVYSPDKGYGLAKAPNDKNRARDDTFPPGALYRDWLNMSEGWQHYEFKVDLPNGTYTVWTCFSDPGYWGGESIRHTVRKIIAEGEVGWEENLGDKGNYWKPNYLFENVEPLTGQDFWKVYMEKIFSPVTFKATVTDGQLNLVWNADKGWSTKVNSIVIYPETKASEGKAFTDSVAAAEAQVFRNYAAENIPGSGGNLAALPAAEKDKGWVFFLTDYMTNTFQTTIPDASQIKREKQIYAAQGEREPIAFAVRPLRDMGAAKVEISDFTGGGKTIAGDNFEARVVRHLSRRGFGTINYTITPQMLKKLDTVSLPKDITREFVVWAKIPKDAAAGDYTGTVTVSSTGGLKESLKVKLTVYPFNLDNSEYVFGFYGTIKRYEDAKLLRDLGFNSFSGGYKMNLKGFAKDGTPDIDFSGMDGYQEMLKKAGYTQEGWGYGGFQVSHIGYTKDEAFFGKWEKETGLSYHDLLKKVFDAVEAHSKANEWLPGVYGMVDETRNVDFAKKQVAQIKAVNAASDWIKTGGSYSARYDKGKDPKDYHQWIFEVLEASSLNNHDAGALRRAKEIGAEVYIYNQGLSRYSFGAYQWSEYQKGVRGRHQWHLHVQHGYQFFDLDAREPDSASVLYYGENEPIPTLNLVRCSEGADDFYYCQTLHNLCEKAKAAGKTAEAAEARKVLEEVESRIKVNEKRKPDWVNNDKLRRDCAQSIIKLQNVLAGPAAAPEAVPAETPAAPETAAVTEEPAPTEAPAPPAADTGAKDLSQPTQRKKSKGCGAAGVAWMASLLSLFFVYKRQKRSL